MKRTILSAALVLLSFSPPLLAQNAAPPAPANAPPAEPGLDAADHAFGVGLVAAGNGRYAAAVENFSEAIRLRPDMQKAYAQRGIAYFVLDKYKEAVADFTEALRLEPDDTSLLPTRGLSYLKLKDFEKALWDYDRYLAGSPGALQGGRGRGWASQPLYGRGLARLGLGDMGGGYADIEIAKEQNPDVEKYFKDLAFATPPEKPKDLPPPSGQIPARYRAAINDTSDSPLLVHVTIVNDSTKESRSGCVTARSLRAALRAEDGLKPDYAGTLRAQEMALANKERVFHFGKQAALDAVKMPYAESDRAAAEEELKYVDIPRYDGPLPGYRLTPAVAAAMACMFVENGKPVRSGTGLLVQP